MKKRAKRYFIGGKRLNLKPRKNRALVRESIFLHVLEKVYRFTKIHKPKLSKI